MLLCGEKMGLELTHRIVHKSIGSARSQFLGIVHDSVFYPQLHHFRWLTPHFEGNHNIFLSDTILLKTQKFKIFMNMPILTNQKNNEYMNAVYKTNK